MVAALAATSFVTATAQGVSAAGGELKVTTVSTFAPASVPNAQIMRMVRLAKSSSFLVVGIDQTTAGANARVWKLKDDLTVDTTFAAVDLGDDTEKPSAANSDCVAQNRSNCYRVDGFTVNETAGKYAIAFTRNVTVSVNQGTRSLDVYTLVTGDIATGAVTGRRNFLGKSAAYDPTTDFAAYSPSTLMSDTCTAEVGATYQGIDLGYSTPRGFNMAIRTDGSILIYLNCFYYSSTQSSLTEYNVHGIVALKVANSSLAIDSSWGSNGFRKVFDDATKCGDVYSNTIDSSITTNSSAKLFTIVSVQTYNRVTTYPFGGNITSYNGCATMGSIAYSAVNLLTVKANGAILSTVPTTITQSLGRWIIDSDGRWNNTVSRGVGSSMTTSLLRITAAGALDTTLDPSGMKVLPNLPPTITVNGTSVNMRYTFTGIAISSKGVMFSGFSTASTSTTFNCSNAAVSYQTTYYPYYLTLEDGLVTDYGTNGLGEGHVLQQSSEDVCRGTNFSVGFVNGKGQPTQINNARAIGSQTAGVKMAVWNAAAGVTSGGDGSGLVGSGGAAGRVDTKVYSTRLPATAQTDSALRVLTAGQADDFDIRTNTPKICIALTTSVLMVNPGRCSVRIIDEDTKKVIRTMSTIVRKSDVETGTTLTTDEPIYFRQASNRLSKNAQAQIAELAAAAASAGRVVIIGHSAALGEVSVYSYAISRGRAEAVRAALVKAGVKVPIEIVAMAYTQPEKTAKTEAAQAKNRRAEVYIFPK